MSEDTQEVSEQVVESAEEQGMAAFGAAAAAIKKENEAEEPQPAAVVVKDEAEVIPAETPEGAAPAEPAAPVPAADGTIPPVAEPAAKPVPPVSVTPALQALNEAAGIKTEEPAPVTPPPAEAPVAAEPSETEKALQAKITELEAEKAEYSKTNPPAVPTMKERIEAIEDETQRTAMLDQYELYPELIDMMSTLLPGGQQSANGDVTAQVEAILKEREDARVANEQVTQKYVADVVNGYKDEAGADVVGHKDAIALTQTEEFHSWLSSQAEPIRTIFSAGNAGDTIKLISAYKEHAVLSTKADQDGKTKTITDDQDELNSTTVRGVTPGPVDKSGKPIDMEAEFAAASKKVAAEA